MDNNDLPNFYDQTNEDDLPPLITENQSAISYSVLKDSFVPQAAIMATPVSYCFPSSSFIITNDKVELSYDVPKPMEEELKVEKPSLVEEEVVVEEMDKAQSSEETIVEIFDDDDDDDDSAKKEVPEVIIPPAVVQADDRNKGKGLLLLEGQVKPSRKKRTKVLPDWLVQNFIIEARCRVNGKTVDKYYYHRVTKVKCRSTIEAEEYFLHGISPSINKKRKRIESERIIVKFLRESYENLLSWFKLRYDFKDLFEEMMKNENKRRMHEDKGKDKDKEFEKSEVEVEDKGKGIPESIVVDGEDEDGEVEAMEVSKGGPMSLDKKKLVEVPVDWFW